MCIPEVCSKNDKSILSTCELTAAGNLCAFNFCTSLGSLEPMEVHTVST